MWQSSDVPRIAADELADAVVDAGGQAKLFVCDLSAEQNVERLFDDILGTWGRLDIVVNNAAATRPHGTRSARHRADHEDFEHFIRSGLYSIFWCFKHGIPAMHPAGGTFVTISSLAAIFREWPQPSYAAPKPPPLRSPGRCGRLRAPRDPRQRPDAWLRARRDTRRFSPTTVSAQSSELRRWDTSRRARTAQRRSHSSSQTLPSGSTAPR